MGNSDLERSQKQAEGWGWGLCALWDLTSPAGIEPGPMAVNAWSPHHWTTREFPSCVLLIAGVGQASFKYFQSAEEARHAIEAVLSADPRSVYRRKLCQDRLFYFTVDTAHVTCWFGDGFAEVLRIKPASEPVQMSKPAESPVSLGS